MVARPEVRSVWQVARYLRETLDGDPRLRDIWVAGEISNLTLASSGHAYFTIKDEASQLRCAFFRSQNVGQVHRLQSGASLIVHGAISIYEPRGELQMIVDFVQPAGVGALQAEFERRRAGYAEEGLFDPARKRPLPRFPRRIGVVTSAQGAAFHDIQTVLERRWPLATIVFAPALVQGDQAAEAVAGGIRALNALPEDRRPDVLIVGRGGGSAEDLWAFNEDAVVRAIFGSALPVVSAVGHETDITLADLVADLRAPTPSAAAETVAPDRGEVLRSVRSLLNGNAVRVTRQVAVARQQVDRGLLRMERRLPEAASLHRHVATLADRMRHDVLRRSGEAREQTIGVAARLRTLSPLATLERGYALVADEDGRPVASASEVQSRDLLGVTWRDGTRRARVESDA
ncbi:MAG: exodeoxyribonuclease VII large subunit [Chloroflexi bacterium]|nr:exodeoxyribonuclease VII large subunit [Chloroflexota bacterium]MDA1239544.1 exodeoxyribonuclease VII large subunit [Chloroflexota bacterium]MQC25502.1 exodeoxyribonuclease VII large subunit [Chloroflexota bacterium]MQC48193.1 exodeoxyribonuclease VII large subunit [Chloroflexota bacterium]